MAVTMVWAFSEDRAIAASGIIAPATNDTADAIAALHGFATSSESTPSSVSSS